MFARPSLSPGLELRSIKRTEQPRFLEAEEKLKKRCSDAGVEYDSHDSDEDEDATHRRRDRVNTRIPRKQNDVRSNTVLSLL